MHSAAAPDGSGTCGAAREARVRLEVTDQGSSSVPRARREADPFAESGHGLRLVGLFARDWWARGGRHGRTVIAELDAGKPVPPVLKEES